MIEVGAERFLSKKALRDRCREILYRPGGEFAPGDEAFLLALLELHPEARLKIGCGIVGFARGVDPRGSIHFIAHRSDGSTTDFSFNACISAPRYEAELRAACRTAVGDRIAGFKAARFGDLTSIQCEVTGAAVTWDSCHVDHAPPWTFEAIVSDFVNGSEFKHARVFAIAPTRDLDTVTRFANESDAAAFLAFHDARAVLRIVSKHTNLSLLRRRR
jgi:hypothetical protein